MIAIDLSKQKALEADPKAKQQINFTGNLEKDENENTTIFLINEEAKERVILNCAPTNFPPVPLICSPLQSSFLIFSPLPLILNPVLPTPT